MSKTEVSPLDNTSQPSHQRGDFIVHTPGLYDQLGHSMQEGDWPIQRSLENYVTATDGIIGILDGSISNTDRKGDKVYTSKKRHGRFELESVDISKAENVPKPDAVLWLDKSARPIAWLTKELWDQLAVIDEDGEIPEKPKNLFLNIDRRPWVSKANIDWREKDPSRLTNLDINEITPDGEQASDHIGRIRLLFVQDKRIDEDGKAVHLSEDNWQEEVWKMPLKNKPDGSPYEHVLIVDEVKFSGDTLDIAQRLVSAALPELAVSGVHWYKPHNSEWNPAWYSKQDTAGRSVGDIDDGWYITEEGKKRNFKHRLASIVLSPPLINKDTGERRVDQRALRLRKDMGRLAKDLAEHKLLYRPASVRSKKAQIERLETLNGGISLRDIRSILSARSRSRR